MAIKFTGNHVCANCGKTFEWCYDEPIRVRSDAPVSSYVVEELPQGKSVAYECASMGNDHYIVSVNCSKCGEENRFDYSPK